MISFSSQIGTKNKRGTLVPFGWTRNTILFRDSIADFEHDRAQMEGRVFGRRENLVREPYQPHTVRRFDRAAPEPRDVALLPHPKSLAGRTR